MTTKNLSALQREQLILLDTIFAIYRCKSNEQLASLLMIDVKELQKLYQLKKELTQIERSLMYLLMFDNSKDKFCSKNIQLLEKIAQKGKEFFQISQNKGEVLKDVSIDQILTFVRKKYSHKNKGV